MSTTSDPHGHHDWHGPEYVDDWIARDAQRPERAVLLDDVAARLPFPTDAALRVLDIGGGYGALSACVLDRFPHSSAVLHDFSQPMLAHAADALARFGDRVTFRVADLRDPRWTAAVGGSFDAVVSSDAIHNVRDAAVIERIYHDVFELVRREGWFVNLDLVLAADGSSTVELQEQWLLDAGFQDVVAVPVDERRVRWEARRGR
jgi:cyclopropane fatty-acyl-phospholipid synthase-like methyltransferase